MADATQRLEVIRRLAVEQPDPRLVFEHASALDAADDPAGALPLYEAALAGGLREPHRHRAQIQAASTLRLLGDQDRALQLLDGVTVTHPGNAAAVAFRALVLADAGRPAEAVADLVGALVDHVADDDTAAYRRVLHRYASELRAVPTRPAADLSG